METGESTHAQTSRSIDKTETNRERNTVRLAVIVVALAIVTSLFYLYLLTQSPVWQLAVSFTVTLLLGGIGVAAIFLIRRGKPTLAAVLLNVGIIAIVLTVAALYTNAGLMLALVLVVGNQIFITQTLPSRWYNLAIVLGVIFAGIAALLEFYAVPIQIDLPAITRYLPIITGAGILGSFIYLFVQFRSLDQTNKIFSIFLLVTLLVAGSIVIVTQRSTTQALTENVGLSLSSVANTQATGIGIQLGKQLDLLNSLSISRNMVEAVKLRNSSYTGNESEIQAEINTLDQEWIQTVEAGSKYIQAMYESQNNDVARQLLEFKRTYPDQAEVFVTDQYGALFATTNVTSDYNQADEEWWQKAYNEGKGNAFISSPVFDESAGVLSIQIAVPVRDYETPRILGVLRGTYNFSALESILGHTTLGRTGESDLMYPGEDFRFMRMHAGEAESMDENLLLQLNQASMDFYTELNYDGVESLISQAPVIVSADTLRTLATEISDLGWYVIVHQSSAEALAPVQAQTRTTLFLVVVIVGLVSAGAVWLARFLARPIIQLTGVAERIRGGDLSARAPVTSNDEVGQLATTFNEMTGRLRQILAGLEQRVSERTLELTLAAEVGRALSQERDLDRLLRQAVERIQSSFDLYYTQIYLVDTSGEALALRSGTGTVGEELLKRRHRLQLSSASINGLAATEKRAVVVADTTTSPLFRPNPLLPDTRSELAMPLMVGDRVVGVLDMQSQQVGALSEETVPAFEALAGQLAIAIENAALFVQTQEAQAELENQARRLSREGWREFLDAIERSERIGYVYDSVDVKPNNEIFAGEVHDNALMKPIQVSGEEIGRIFLEQDDEHPWAAAEDELVEVVATQVSRQVENLRLLAQAERYRDEAEIAARRLTRQGWEDYLDELGKQEISFIYDQTQVQPAFEKLDDKSLDDQEVYFSYPLKIRDETIGELALGGDRKPDENDLELINEVSERLSVHLESLRLAAQTQVALAKTDALYGISSSLNEALNEQEIIKVLSQPAVDMGAFSSNLIYLDLDENGAPEWAEVKAVWPVEYEHAVAVGTRFFLPEMPFAKLWVSNPNEPVLVSDVYSDVRVDENTKTAMAHGGSRAIAIIPLTRSGQQIGLLIFNWDRPHDFNPQEMETYQALIGLGSPAVQNRRLFMQTQARAQHERILRQVTERVRNSIDPDAVLRTAVRELGNVLGRNVLIRLSSIEAPPDNTHSSGKSGNGNGKK
jgi:GAF domain-containing protein/HAMP domain-containing protein